MLSLVLLTMISMLATPVVLMPESKGAGQAKTELEGVWDAVESHAGEMTRVFKPDEVRLTFKGDVLLALGLVEPRREERQVQFRIDSSVTPKQFDYLRAPGEMMLSIYDVSGDVLRIAVPRRNREDRPTSFDPKTAPITLLVLKRRPSQQP